MTDQPTSTPPAAAPRSPMDPFTAFRSEMDRVIDGFFGGRSPFAMASFGPADLRVGGAALMPSVDVSEDTAAITVTAELPGLTEKDVELTLDDGVLTLKGEKREEKTDATAHVTERRYGRFQRSFRLPDNADHPAIAARVDNGVLRVVIPKNPNAVPKARTIPIAGKT